MFLFEKLLEIQRFLSSKNPFFSIQFLFVWLEFKLLGFLGIPFLSRFGIVGFSTFLLLFFWEAIIPRVLCNRFFQYYLIAVYVIVNYCSSFKNGAFYFGLFLSCIGFLLPLRIVSFNMNVYFIPNLDYFLFILLLFSFFKRFNQNIIIPEISKGFNFKPFRIDCFHWLDLLNLISSYFIDKFLISNKIASVSSNKMFFENFPFPKSFMRSLEKIGFDNSAKIFSKSIKQYSLENLTENQKEKIIKESLQELEKDFSKKQKVTEQAAFIAFEINKTFYWSLLLGLLLGSCILLFLFNFI